MTETAIVWFRRDLRVHDHPSLTAAAAREGERASSRSSSTNTGTTRSCASSAARSGG